MTRALNTMAKSDGQPDTSGNARDDGRIPREGLAALRGACGVVPGQRGLLLVSGGSDSMALLHLLHTLRGALDVALDVVHFDHGLRPESAREADWVAEQARARDLPAHIVRATHLATLGSGVQAAAREWRQRETARLMGQWDAAWAATGHQRDDHHETLLLKLLRGAHLSRLEGLRHRTEHTIRPLMQFGREELRQWLRAGAVPWLEDPTNDSPAYRRNRVRHALLPLLDDLAGGAIGARLEGVMAQSAQFRALMDWGQAGLPAPAMSDPAHPHHWLALGPDTHDTGAPPGWLTWPMALQSALLFDFLRARSQGTPTHAEIQTVLERLALEGAGPGTEAAHWRLSLSHGRELERRGPRLFLRQEGQAPPRTTWEETALPGGGALRHPPGWVVAARTGESTGSRAMDEEWLTLHGLPPAAALELRLPMPGDRFHPPGREAPLKLREFLRARGLPAWARERAPLLLHGGRIVAIYPNWPAQGHHTPATQGPPQAALRLHLTPPADG